MEPLREGIQILELAERSMLGRKANPRCLRTCSNYSPRALWFRIRKMPCEVLGGLGRSRSIR
jgi:hypothetical protein